MGFEIITQSDPVTELPDSLFTAVREDALIGLYLFGKDAEYSTRNRRIDRQGAPLSIVDNPTIGAEIGAITGSATGHFDTGLAETEAMTVMAVCRTTGAAAANPDIPLIFSNTRSGQDGISLRRTETTLLAYADWDVDGADTFGQALVSDLPTATSQQPFIVCLTVDANGLYLKDMTADKEASGAAPADNSGRFLFPDSIRIGQKSPAVPRGPMETFAFAIWNDALTQGEMDRQHDRFRALFGDLGLTL